MKVNDLESEEGKDFKESGQKKMYFCHRNNILYTAVQLLNIIQISDEKIVIIKESRNKLFCKLFNLLYFTLMCFQCYFDYLKIY